MRWEYKAAIQATLSRVPHGYALHRKLQDLIGSSHLDINDQYGRKAKFMKRALSQGLSFHGKSFLEIGTGWHPLTPLLLHLLGAARTATIDINPWLTAASLRETLEALGGVAERVNHDFGVRASDSRDKINRLLAACDAGERPREVLRIAGIEYGMPVDACATGFPDRSFDYVVSSNVLEHLPPERIWEMLVESKRILKLAGFHLHHVNPGDHFSYDRRITSANFLKYSPEAWYLIGGSGLAYHNRLRCVDYVRLFERGGFEIIYQRTEVDPVALRTIEEGRLTPHPVFNEYSNEQLAEHIIDVFARVAG